MITSVNPEILVWARERSGYSIEDLAKSLRKDPQEVERWETGESAPSYTILDQLAYRYFRVPLAVFFFPKPPQIESPRGKFRRLPDYELERLSANTLSKIHLAQSFQSSLEELLGQNPAELKLWRKVKVDPRLIEDAAGYVRNLLRIPLDRQFTFRTVDQALRAWRHSAETVGVYTFKDTFKDRFISGFSLFHTEFPVVMLNNSNAFARQLFTLAHELGHILLGLNGISDVSDDYFDYMSDDDRDIEVACNRFAAELLVPRHAFVDDVTVYRVDGKKALSEIAAKYSVSREVIARRLLDFDEISESEYARWAGEWNRDYLRKNRDNSSGDHYRTKLAYLGEGFTRMAFSSYSQGAITKADLAIHLREKARNLDKLASYVGI